MAGVCETPGCGKDAKLKCPTCVKLNFEGSMFCSQDCFKGYWKEHKKIHSKFDNSNTNSIQSLIDETLSNFTWTGPLRPYKKTPKRAVPASIQRPDYADDQRGVPWSEREVKSSHIIQVLSEEDQESLRVVCKLAREILDEGVKAVGIGVSSDEIDRVVHEATIERDCYPSPLNYYGFPKSCCTSVNEVICHGIPDLRPLQSGDIVNIDVTAYHRGFHGDLNETLFVGHVDEAARKLVETTYECLAKASKIIKPGTKYRDVGDIIQRHAQSNGFSVVRTYCGHGIHRLFHCFPNVPHYARNKAVGIMKPGHSFTIEPMINEGSWRDDRWPDDWTAVTSDGKRSAQFEDTFLVTESGCEILTARKSGQPYFMDVL